MLAVELLFAVQVEMFVGIVVVMALAMGLLVPYLVKEIQRGKVELGPHDPRAQR